MPMNQHSDQTGPAPISDGGVTPDELRRFAKQERRDLRDEAHEARHEEHEQARAARERRH